MIVGTQSSIVINSPVVVPGMDYTEMADQAFERFAEAGMKLVKSTDPVESWYPR